MYTVSSSLNTDEPIMLINVPIGYDESHPSAAYVDGAKFQEELLEIDGMGKKRICIHINCVGGNVMEGYNICSAILKSKTPVDTYNVGIAASMAGAIFMCGRQRVMMDYSVLMIHNPFGGSDKKQLQAMRESLVTMISAKCNLGEKAVAYLMDRESWIGSAECLEKGFCTEIEVTARANQKRMPIAEMGVRAMWEEADKIYNNILNSPQMDARATGVGMIAAYLELNTEASENAVFSEVKRRISKEVMAREKAEEDTAKMKKDLDDAEDRYMKMKKAFDQKVEEEEDNKRKVKAAADKAEADRAEAESKAAAKIKLAEEETKRVSAKAMVDSFVGKRIKADAIDEWVNTAIVLGLDKAKALIEGLPLNQNATPVQASATGNPGAGNNLPADPTKAPASTLAYSAKVLADVRNRHKANGIGI